MRFLALSCICLSVACGGDKSSGGTPDNHLKTVVSAIKVGSPPGAYASDLDGDGTKDDALGRISTSLSAASGIDLQGDLDAAIADGDTLMLMDVASHDDAFENDDAATITIQRAQAHSGPDFSGQGSFTVDPGIEAITVDGKIVAGVFTSSPPDAAPQPLSFALALGGDTIEVPIVDVHVTTTINAGAKTLAAGKLAGAIAQAGIAASVMPVLAAQYNALIAASPTSVAAIQVLFAFDTGGCAGGIAGNGHLELCEVTTNGLLGAVFVPDVDIFDAGGNIAPTSTGAADSLSLGVGFSGVNAAY
jgi:hypothetical protein